MKRRAFLLTVGVFFLSGFISVLNSILIPHLQERFSLSYASGGLVFLSFYLAYFLVSPLSGYLFQKKNALFGMRFAIFFAASGTALLWAAGAESGLAFLLFGIFILGSGIAAGQVVGNPYLMQAGEAKEAPSRLAFAHGGTSLGMLLAPSAGTACLLSESCRGSFSGLYGALAGAWLLFMLLSFAGLPGGSFETRGEFSVIRKRSVQLGALAIALAVGVEVAVGGVLVRYLARDAGFSLESAGKASALYWSGFAGGRFIGALLAKKIEAAKLLLAHALLGAFFAAYVIFGQGLAAAAAALLLGFCASVLFPFIYSSVLSRAKGSESYASGLLCMANIGGGILPIAQGFVADHYSLRVSFAIPCLAFLLLAAYARTLRYEIREKSPGLGSSAG